MEENQIIKFLLSKPDFFLRHSEILNQITLANPYGKRAISLSERQIQILREKNKILEAQIKDFLKFGKENSILANMITNWCASLFMQNGKQPLPTLFAENMASIFSLSYTKVIFFRKKNEEEIQVSNNITDKLYRFVKNLNKPYCNNEGSKGEMGWLFSDDNFSKNSSSFALLPLRHIKDIGCINFEKNQIFSNIESIPYTCNLFGTIILGDKNKERFTKRKSTDFLEQIARISSAALSKHSFPRNKN